MTWSRSAPRAGGAARTVSPPAIPLPRAEPLAKLRAANLLHDRLQGRSPFKFRAVWGGFGCRRPASDEWWRREDLEAPRTRRLRTRPLLLDGLLGRAFGGVDAACTPSERSDDHQCEYQHHDPAGSEQPGRHVRVAFALQDGDFQHER